MSSCTVTVQSLYTRISMGRFEMPVPSVQVSGSRYQVCKFLVPGVQVSGFSCQLRRGSRSQKVLKKLSYTVSHGGTHVIANWCFPKPENAVNLPMSKLCSCPYSTLVLVFGTYFQKFFWKEHLRNVMTLVVIEVIEIW